MEMLPLGANTFGPRTAGIDEAGRGPLAGPVVAAAVILPLDFHHAELNDSKKLSASKREELALIIKQHAIQYSIIAIGHRRVDILNIRQATRLAMSLALSKISADAAIIDGNMTINTLLPQFTIIKGDSKYLEIAAASILAKVYRDHLMKKLGRKYQGYGLERHAGYPTKSHRAAIASLGPSRIHRQTFNLLGKVPLDGI
jgi:ribonuclease HII